MTFSTFAAALEDLLARIERTDVLGLIERHPGIEAATEDLYATALAVVRDASAGPPDPRRLRLLRDARLRYRERLTGARPGERLRG
jgi:hypothetical protein